MALSPGQVTAPGWAGPEHPCDSGGNKGGAEKGGAESGALGSDSTLQPAPATPADPELAAVVAAWPDLPPAIRAAVSTLAKVGRV